MIRSVLCLLLLTPAVYAADSPHEQQSASFELVWTTLRDHYWDPTMAGRDWQAIHDSYRAKFDKAPSPEEAEAILQRMIHELPSSHLAIIPASLYRTSALPLPAGKDEPNDDESGTVGLDVIALNGTFAIQHIEANGAAAKAGVHSGWTIDAIDGTPASEFLKHAPPGSADDRELFAQEILAEWLRGPQGSTVTVVFQNTSGQKISLPLVRQTPEGELVEFGNLPPEHVLIEHRLLPEGAGYIRLNVFLSPVLVMPAVERAIKEFRNARGIVFDLRGNPGGLGIMAMGIAGWFVSEHGKRLGTMTSRDGDTPFEINPRWQAYAGPLAILVDHGSASTSEIFAQGLKDLGRARIFGSRTAGAALPSEIVPLPNGDRFQYPEANYTSMNGLVLEGNGVVPDVTVKTTLAALAQGRDLPLESAVAWIQTTAKSGKLENIK